MPRFWCLLERERGIDQGDSGGVAVVIVVMEWRRSVASALMGFNRWTDDGTDGRTALVGER